MSCGLLMCILIGASSMGPVSPAAAYEFNATIVSIFFSSSELTFDSNVVIPAVAMAVQGVSKMYPHIRFELVVRNSSRSCLEHHAGALAAEVYYGQGATAFVGPGCSAALDHVGRMAAYWNVPAYTAGGLDDTFIHKGIYSTLTQLSFSLDRVGAFIISIVREFDWHHIAIFVDESSLPDVLTMKSIEQAMKRAQQYELLPERYYFTRHDAPEALVKRLRIARDRARVFLILCAGDTVRKVLLLAHSLGMGNGDFVFINVNLIESQSEQNGLSWFKQNDRMNKVAKLMYESLLVIRVRVPTTLDYRNFVALLIKYAKDNYNYVLYEYDGYR
ncbi:atrial natriuretic peptide receptor 3-like [Haemaphysalis longicornis]